MSSPGGTANDSNQYTDMDPVERASLMAENEDLQSEVEELRSRAFSVQEERDLLLEKLEDVHEERDELMEENAKLKAAIFESSRREEYLELQLHQAMFYSDVSGDQMLQSMKDMLSISSQIKAGNKIPVSSDIEIYLENLGISNINEPQINNVLEAQRNAISAVAAVDASGRLLRKWAVSGDTCLDKLMRLENRLKRLEEQEDQRNQD